MNPGFGVDLGQAVIQPVVITLLAFTLGYHYRSYSLPRTQSPSSITSSWKASSSSDSVDGTDTDSDAEDESAALTSDIASLKANATEDVKLVLVVNDSLKMAKGKIAAQAGHATLACAMLVREVNPKVSGFGAPRGES